MAKELHIRTTDKLQEVNVDHLYRGKYSVTLCVECLDKALNSPKWLVMHEVTSLPPHPHCNECGAITKELFAKLYS